MEEQCSLLGPSPDHRHHHYHHHRHNHHRRAHQQFADDHGYQQSDFDNVMRRRGSAISALNGTNDHRHNGRSPDIEEDTSDSGSQNKTSDIQTMMHVLKTNIGTGVLAMPRAFKNAGLWLGFGLLPVIGTISIHCMHILISSHNRLCDKFNYESLDYDQVAALALACGPRATRRLAGLAQLVVTCFLMFTQFGFCCVYVMFVVENIQLAMYNLFALNWSTSTYMLLLFPIIGVTSCISNLRHLAIISTIANMLQLTGLALIFADLFQLPSTEQADGSTMSQIALALNGSTSMMSSGLNETTTTATAMALNNHHDNRPLAISNDLAGGLPLYFATVVYAFEGIGVVLPLVKEMERPELFPGFTGVLNTSMMLVAVLYMAMGYFGYLKYGQAVSGSITIDLPRTTLNEFVRIMFAMAIGLSYSLQFYVPWTIAWPWIDETLFYSYRPRAPRDILDLKTKISRLNRYDDLTSSSMRSAAKRSSASTGSPSGSSTSSSSSSSDTMSCRQNTDTTGAVIDDDGAHSTASTLATSYMMSASVIAPTSKWGPLSTIQTQLSPLPEITNQGTRRKSPDEHPFANIKFSAGSEIELQPHQQQQQQQQQQAIDSSSHQQPSQRSPIITNQANYQTLVKRNRLDDLIDDSQDTGTQLPDVQWRPPPSSMRGKRKLVRYTVILISVSLTFVAAALIPRLDLFISLVGAFSSSSLAIIFPPFIELCTFWANEDSDGPAYRFMFMSKNLLIILFGIAGLITGTWVSLQELASATYRPPMT